METSSDKSHAYHRKIPIDHFRLLRQSSLDIEQHDHIDPMITDAVQA